MKLNKTIHLKSFDDRMIGDIMPTYIDGRYHIFYLLNASGNENIDHEHAITDDLMNYTYRGRSIEHSNLKDDFLHNGCMFTGCYIKEKEIYHAFYTSYNLENPEGREFIIHKKSLDLNSFQDEGVLIKPDGIVFSDQVQRDFRDPAIYYNEQLKRYEMFILANESGSDQWITGLYVSDNLENFKPEKIISGGVHDECPSYYRGKKYHFLHGCHQYSYSEHRLSNYRNSNYNTVDLPFCRAAKIVFNGFYYLWFGGWTNGKMSIPRVMYDYKKYLFFKFDDHIERKFIHSEYAYGNYEFQEDVYLFNTKINFKKNPQIEFISNCDQIILQFFPKRLEYSINKKKYIRKVPLKFKSCIKIKGLIESDLLEIFIDKKYVITIPLENMEKRKIINKNQLIHIKKRGAF